MTSLTKIFPVKTEGEQSYSSNKIAIIGVGQVGIACAIILLAKEITNEIALVDIKQKADTLFGEMLDFQHAAKFWPTAKITSGTSYCVTAGCKICVITAGFASKPGETRLDLLQRNANVFKEMIPKIMEYNPNPIFVIVTNPVDILTYVTWKVSGLPRNRVIGTGTGLDSSRFQFFISQKLSIPPSLVHGWIIGEHGDSSVPVWSSVHIAGVRLKEINPNVGADNDQENWQEVHKRVVHGGYDVLKLKGYTNWAVAMTVADCCTAILKNSHTVHAVTTLVQGQHCVDKEVFISLPCVLGSDGVESLVKLNLERSEIIKFRKSAEVIYNAQSSINI